MMQFNIELKGETEKKAKALAKRLGLMTGELFPLALANLETLVDKIDKGYKWALVKMENGIENVECVQFQWMDDDGIGNIQ